MVYENYGIKIKQFYGGTTRGVCYQVNVGSSYLQLEAMEFLKFIIELMVYALSGHHN